MSSDESSVPSVPSDEELRTPSPDATSTPTEEDILLEQRMISRSLIVLHIIHNLHRIQPSVAEEHSEVRPDGRVLHSLVQAIARVSSNVPRRSDGAAAAVEIHKPCEGSETVRCILRLAFSDEPDKQLDFMNSVLEEVEKYVLDLIFGDELVGLDLFTAISRFLQTNLDVKIAKHNAFKLTKFLKNRLHKVVFVWEATKRWMDANPIQADSKDQKDLVIGNLMAYRNYVDAIIGTFQMILNPTISTTERIGHLATCIHHAWRALHGSQIAFAFECVWRVLLMHGIVSQQDEDEVWDGWDEEMSSHVDQALLLDLTAPPRSVILKVFLMFARYETAGHRIVRSVHTLHSYRQPYHISLEPVPGHNSQSRTTQSLDLPSNLQEVFEELQIPVDSELLEALQERWEEMLLSTRLRIHPEIRLALFYACNPEVWPMSGIIATSKNPCTACQKFLSLVNCNHAEGRLLNFSYYANPHRPDGTWMFPPIGNNVASLPQDVRDFHKKLASVSKEMVPYLEGELSRTLDELQRKESQAEDVPGQDRPVTQRLPTIEEEQ